MMRNLFAIDEFLISIRDIFTIIPNIIQRPTAPSPTPYNATAYGSSTDLKWDLDQAPE